MTYAIFWGCKIPYYLPEYAVSTSAVLNELGLQTADLEFNCCGYPVRHLDRLAWLTSAARNFALADRAGHHILTPCKCCFGSLKGAAHALESSKAEAGEISEILAREGLSYHHPVEVRHLIQVLNDEVGPEKIKGAVTVDVSGARPAVSYGCHALRPGRITGFDNPADPACFENIVAACGAVPVDYPERLECCGNPLAGKNDRLSDKLAQTKAAGAKAAGADYLLFGCTYCGIQFKSSDRGGLAHAMLPQLIGLSLGLEPESLGLDPGLAGLIINKQEQQPPEAEE